MSRNLQFSELHNALLAWFSQGHTRFVMGIEEGPWKGCVLHVSPRAQEDPQMELDCRVRYSEYNEEGCIVARHEKAFGLTDWVLDAPLDRHVVNDVVSRLQGRTLTPPICQPGAQFPV